jgi:hypothetical protein
MNSPFETNGFTHFLNFISLGFTELYQISEPSGFDAANFVVKQNEERFSCDIIYGNDQINLMFYKGNFERSENKQVQDVNGRTSNYLDNGLNWILETRDRFGFEGKIEYILKKDNASFTTGLLDMAIPDTDGVSFFGCTVIQNNQVSDYKKHEGTTINMFGTKNIKGQTITPAATLKVLRKSVPSFNDSKFECKDLFGEDFIAQGNFHVKTEWYYYNNLITKVVDELDYTLEFNNKRVGTGDDPDDSVIHQFTIFKAKDNTQDIKIIIKELVMSILTLVENSGDGFCDNEIIVSWGYDPVNPLGSQTLISAIGLDENNGYISPSQDYTIDIPYLPIDAEIWFFGRSKIRQSGELGSANMRFKAIIDISKYTIDISATSIALDSVLKGVRYINMMKQCSKFINNLPINAPRFDIGGEFYDQVCFNRALISQDTTRPFNTTFKEILGSVQEVCGDYKITKNEIFAGQYPDFYKNIEIGVFKIIPSADYREDWSDRAKINNFVFGYKTFEQNRLSKNTIGDIHTESKWIVPNSMVENSKEIQIDLVRSAYSQQVAVNLEVSTPQTSDENDDKVYIVDIVENTETANNFSANLTMNWINGRLNLSNKNSTTANENAVINWKISGAEKDEEFIIVSGVNVGTYSVFSVTAALIVLESITTISEEINGDHVIQMQIPYTGVDYVTRTNQDFIISGKSASNYYPNLKYSIRENMKYWESFLNTACQFNQDKTITNSYFKNDPDLTTQFDEGIIYTQKADIPVSSLNEKLITSKLPKLKVACDFNQIIDLLNVLETTDGFVRCYNIDGKIIRGFIQDLDYTWKTNELNLVLEEKYEVYLVTVDFINGVLVVSDVIYELIGDASWWQVNDEFFVAYDKNNIPICNKTRFDKVSLNGVVYDTEFELITALNSLE